MVRLTEPRMMCMSDPTAPPFWEAVLRMMCSSYNGTSLLRGRPTYGVTDRPTHGVSGQAIKVLVCSSSSLWRDDLVGKCVAMTSHPVEL